MNMNRYEYLNDDISFRVIYSNHKEHKYIYQRGYYENGLLSGWGMETTIQYTYRDNNTFIDIDEKKGFFINGKLNGIGISSYKSYLYKEDHIDIDSNMDLEPYIIATYYEIGFFKDNEHIEDKDYDRIVDLDEDALLEYHFVDYVVTRATYSNGFVHFYNEWSNINLYIYKDEEGRAHGITVGRFDGELDVDVVNRSDSEIIDRLLWSPTIFTIEELKQF